MKKILMYTSLLLIAAGGLNLAHENRMERISWTDRGLSNPPLSHASSLDSTIEGFWNVTLTQEQMQRPEPRVLVKASACSVKRSNHSVEVEQDRNTRERRGYFGINLFNAIPIVDFVHGSVTTDSSDNVKGRK